VFTDEVEINLNMICVLVLDEIGGEVDCIDIVVVDKGSPRHGVVQLLMKLVKLARLRHVVCHGVVLHLSTLMGDDVLTLEYQEIRLLPRNTA
jgi:hypothetical protein